MPDAHAPALRKRLRDPIGRALFSTGSTLHRAGRLGPIRAVGLSLCSAAGWWDAGTDGWRHER